MVIDWTITFGNLLSLISMVGIALLFLNRIGNRLVVVEHDLVDMKQSLRDIAAHTIITANHEGQLIEMEKRIDMISTRVDHYLQHNKR